MDKRVINSFGSITIPVNIRKELGISGSVMLWVDVREYDSGKKEIVLRKSDSSEEFLSKYSMWAEIIAGLSTSSVAIVYNNTLLSLSTDDETEDFSVKNYSISRVLSENIKRVEEGEVAIVDEPDKVPFLSNGSGKVRAICRIKNTGSDRCYFIVLGGTKFSGDDISKKELERRYVNIKKILNII